jgi:hypothetical protein
MQNRLTGWGAIEYLFATLVVNGKGIINVLMQILGARIQKANFELCLLIVTQRQL